MKLDVLWTPDELARVDANGCTAVVIDVLRATTSILQALEAGAVAVVPVASMEEGERARMAARRQSRVVSMSGERGGRRIEGYDFGNSPLEFTSRQVAGRTLVWNTTNGTAAIRRASGARALYLACFRNVRAVAGRVRAERAPAIVVCAGRLGRVSLEDAVCAGLFVLHAAGVQEGKEMAQGGGRIHSAAVGDWDLSDGARAALALAVSVGAPTPAFLRDTEAGRALIAIGLGSDVDFCAAVDASVHVPRLVGGAVVLGETAT